MDEFTRLCLIFLVSFNILHGFKIEKEHNILNEKLNVVIEHVMTAEELQEYRTGEK